MCEYVWLLEDTSGIDASLKVGLANVGKSTLFQAITKCHLGNPAVSMVLPLSLFLSLIKLVELSLCNYRSRGSAGYSS